MRRTRAVAAVGVLGAGAVLYARVWRPWQLHWGATPEEVARPVPGDDIVPWPWFDATRAVTVEAAPEHVWPWLAQMGAFTRAGWYSYDALDNKGVLSSEVVMPELQRLQVGDVLPLSEDGRGFTVESVDPGRSLVLATRQPAGTISSAYLLVPEGARRTRLIHRMRYRIRPRRPGEWLLVVAMDVGELLMARRSLLGVKERAERLARALPGAHEPVDHSTRTPLSYELSVVVRRPPADVYAVLADIQDWTDTRHSGVAMTKDPPGPTRVGTRWYESVRMGPRLHLEITSVVTDAEPGRVLAADFSSPFFTGTLRYTLEPHVEGTELWQVQRLRPVPPLRLAPGPIDRTFRARVLRRLAAVRDTIEGLPAEGRPTLGGAL